VLLQKKKTCFHNLSTEAADKEDGMLYNEPKDWLLPARHFLGHALLKAKKYTEANKVYPEDLKINPGNAWAQRV